MKKIILPFLLFSFIGCASTTSLLTSADEKNIETDERQTELEKERTRDLIEFIKNLEINDFSKDFIIKQIQYKDEQLSLKDERIKAQAKEIRAYRKEASKIQDNKDNITKETTKKIEDCARDAGKGDVLTGLFWLAIIAGVIFVFWLLAVKILPKLTPGGWFK